MQGSNYAGVVVTHFDTMHWPPITINSNMKIIDITEGEVIPFPGDFDEITGHPIRKDAKSFVIVGTETEKGYAEKPTWDEAEKYRKVLQLKFGTPMHIEEF